MSLDHAILGFLAERPRSGYDLKTRCFDVEARALWTADQAQIYRTLDRLKASKLVTSTRKRQSGRPDRRIYEITHAGREALWTWEASCPALPPARDAFLVQLYFGSVLNDESLLGVLSCRRDQHQERLDELRERSADLSKAAGVDTRALVLRQTALDGAIAQERAVIDWLDDCIEAVKEGALPGSEADGAGQRHLFGWTGA